MKLFSTKRFVSLFLLLMAISNTIIASPRSVEQARQTAQQQMSRRMAKKQKSQGNVAAIEPQLVFSKVKQNANVDNIYYYVFSAGHNLGYTIVSGDDRFPAVVGYTEQGDYDADNLPTNLVSFMQAYQDFVDNATETQIEEIKVWKAQVATHNNVEPFMQEKWNQYAPYNNMCPEYKYYSGSTVRTNKSVTGCVATAIAQILHYNKCDKLMADIPAYDFKLTVNGYANNMHMPGISAGETYDLANMLNVYMGNETEEQNNAIAKFMLHIGCAVQMAYGPSSSSSASAETFTKYFGMDKELVRSLTRSHYQISEWDEILYEEIAAGRPVYYDGASTGGGHAFVVHGYNEGLYYVNWGWGGYCDGYFDITILNPHSSSGAGASSSDDGYSMQNNMIIGIQPDNGFVDDVIDAVITSRNNLSGTLNVNGNILSGTVNVSPKNQNLQGKTNVGIGYLDDNGNIIDVSTSYFEMDSEKCPINSYYRDISLRCSFEYEENKTYRLILIESDDKTNWIACRGAANTSMAIKVENGKVKNVTPTSNLSAVATLDEDNSSGYAGMSNSINVTVTNTGDKEYYDKVYVMVGKTEIRPAGYTFALGITAPVGGSTTFDFAYTPNTEGKYNFWILDVNLNEIGKSSITFEKTTPPVLSFVSITCDNASNDDAIIDYVQNSKIAVKKVYDTKADFIFEIKNDGGYYEGSFGILYYDSSNFNFSGSQKKFALPANETTTVKFTVEGAVGDVVGLMIQSADDKVKISGLTNEKVNKHYIYDGNDNLTGSYYNFTNAEICYLAGSNNDDTAVDEINVSKDDDSDDFYNLNGIKVTNPKKGIYIKNGKKYVFK